MHDSRIEDLDNKLRYLQRRNQTLHRRQRAAVLGLLCLLLMAMVGTNPKVLTADRVEAKEFLIRDKSGVRLSMRLAKDGSVGIFLRDTLGKQRLALHAQNDGLAGLVLQDAAGKERLSALSQRDGLTGLYLSDDAGKERLSMITQPDGLGAFYVRDPRGAERVSAVAQKDGLGGIFVSDRSGETVHSFAK